MGAAFDASRSPAGGPWVYFTAIGGLDHVAYHPDAPEVPEEAWSILTEGTDPPFSHDYGLVAACGADLTGGLLGHPTITGKMASCPACRRALGLGPWPGRT
jgi:hypothetical protein